MYCIEVYDHKDIQVFKSDVPMVYCWYEHYPTIEKVREALICHDINEDVIEEALLEVH